MGAVVGREKQRAVDIREVAGVRSGRSGVDVADQDGAVRGTVTLPQLPAVRAILGREEQHPVDVCEITGAGAVGAIPIIIPVIVVTASRQRASRVDVLDEGGAGGGAVTLPQFIALR